MRNLFFSLFAIGVAAVAAMTATTAMLNAPQRSVPAAIADAPAATRRDAAGARAGQPSQPPPRARRRRRRAHTADGAKPAAGAAPARPRRQGRGEDADKDPYEGIAPEELPPDLQYSADSSVSFPTNI